MSNPYRKSVRHLDEIDIYQIGNLYEVKSHAVFHALKKLLCAGKRGAKDYEQDLMEAIESIERELQIVGLNAGHLPDGEGWIEWKKGSSFNSYEYPFVEVKLANGQIRMGKPSAYEWYVRGVPDDIVAYRKAGGMPDVDPEPEWGQRHPDLRFAVRGENGQFVYCKDAPSSGEFWARPVEAEFDEQRIDVIGQNGGEPHYDDWRLKVDWSLASPHHQFAAPTLDGRIMFSMHQPMQGDWTGRPVAQ